MVKRTRRILRTRDVHYTYDGGSRLKTSMIDSTGTSTYTYDIQDRLATYTPAGQTEIAYAYNGLNQKTSMTISGASPTSYGYYANGWLKNVDRGSWNVAAYTYDPVGNRTRLDYGETLTYTTYSYDTDPRYRVSSITHTPRVGSPLTISYSSRDNVGNPTTIDTANYGYDANSRLTSAGGTNYAYDWVGNRNPSTHAHNAADQLTIAPNNRYDYLGTGSLYHQYDSTGQTTQKTYAYTAANLLDSITHNSVSGTPVSSMSWDADSNRISFTSSTGGTTQFVYDITAGIPAVIKEIGPGEMKVYVREPDGSLIAMFQDGVYPYYYHFDALGSTRALSEETGYFTNTYTYDAWGNLTSQPPTIQQPYQYVGQLGYYTHYQDANLSLLQLGVRFYDPQIGRFTQVDAADEESESTYIYAGSSPCTWIDPSGFKRRKLGKDKALQKCLSRLKACVPWTGKVIGRVGGNYGLDDSDDAADAAAFWTCGNKPGIDFNPNGSWKRRNADRAGFHNFCMGVLHELIHVSHGCWGTICDRKKEKKAPDFFEDQATAMYKKGGCFKKNMPGK